MGILPLPKGRSSRPPVRPRQKKITSAAVSLLDCYVISLVFSPSLIPTNRLEMEVEAGRNHMAVVVEVFILDVLVSRFNAF